MPLDLAPGETVLFTAKLKYNRWERFRCVNCSLLCVRSYLGIPFLPFYALFGGSCRRSEAESFELVLTNQNIHFSQKIYSMGICCQNTESKIIPLDKIQDIVLVSNCCGDTCGYVDKAGDIYQLHFQTAGQGTPIPELSVFCIENPREFKRAVLDAKQKVTMQVSNVGHGKHDAVENPTVLMNQEQQARLLRVLEQFESQMPKNVEKHGDELKNPLLV